jgi:hypothetical protein
VISNSFGNTDAITRKYSTGLSRRAIFTRLGSKLFEVFGERLKKRGSNPIARTFAPTTP